MRNVEDCDEVLIWLRAGLPIGDTPMPQRSLIAQHIVDFDVPHRILSPVVFEVYIELDRSFKGIAEIVFVFIDSVVSNFLFLEVSEESLLLALRRFQQWIFWKLHSLIDTQQKSCFVFYAEQRYQVLFWQLVRLEELLFEKY